MFKAEENSNHKKPNVVAKLMGLDEALPRGEANLFLERNHEKCYSQHIYGHLRSPLKHWQVEDSVKDKEMVHGVLHSKTEQNAHNHSNIDVYQDKMALIHQKFMEAKLMSKKSKKFEDGLKVLSSNDDALIRLLDSQNLYDLRRPASPAETELITLLRPSKTLDNNIRSSRMEKNLGYNVPVQSTRIVVLKPSSGKTNDLKAMYSPKTSLEVPEDDFLESRKAKRELTCQWDETLFDCSSNKSYYNYKDRRSFSDLDALMSQLPRHSWDHSLYSTRSLDRVTCSPESSVCIEAKSRLYERWIMMMASSNSKFHHQEQIHVKRRSTLGELLSLSQRKKHVTPKVKDIIIEDQEPRKSRNEELMVDGAPKSRRIRFRDEVCDHDAGKGHGSKSMRLSFKGRVSSFLFLRNKKSTKEKSKDKSQCGALYESFGKYSSDSVSNRKQQGLITLEHELIVSKPEISSENQDQPSPSSILEPLFQDDIHHEFYDSMKSGHQGSLVSLKSNLIDKSPPIESVSRTLSWGDSHAHDSSLDSKAEEEEWLLLVEKLLSAAGLDDQLQNDSFDTRWHSLESPLDPSLRGKYVNLNDREHQHLNEAKRRKMRSSQKLVFDCVNAAILELTNGECGPGKHHKCRVHSNGTCSLSMDHIVDQMKELMASGVRCVWGDCGDSNSLVVENVVKKELVGIGWVQLMELEIDILGMQIERDLIQELVENVVLDFTARASINPF